MADENPTAPAPHPFTRSPFEHSCRCAICGEADWRHGALDKKIAKLASLEKTIARQEARIKQRDKLSAQISAIAIDHEADRYGRLFVKFSTEAMRDRSRADEIEEEFNQAVRPILDAEIEGRETEREAKRKEAKAARAAVKVKLRGRR